MWAKIQLSGKNIFIDAAYILPNADPLAYEQLVSSTKEIIDQTSPVTWVSDSESPYLLRSIDGNI